MFDTAQCTGVDPITLPSAPCAGDTRVAARPASHAASCSSCAMRATCLLQYPRPTDLTRHDSIIHATRMVKQGEALYRTNDSFRGVYAVRTGSFKTVVMYRDDREQVTGFQLPGDVIGLDGVGSSAHHLDAIAIEDSSVCIAPFSPIESLCCEGKGGQPHLLKMMSGEIARNSMQLMLLTTMTAEQRAAAFLLDLSKRLKTCGYSAVEFNLRMTREEIGSYLGLKLETVSRMFSKFQRDGLLDTRGKQIRILDLDGLSRV
jgi:CRP/FNR family transcriptional regulator